MLNTPGVCRKCTGGLKEGIIFWMAGTPQQDNILHKYNKSIKEKKIES
jgi:hypothetical protein